MKRRPEKAAGEFWGGTKTVWEKGKKKEVETDGWYEEMCLKTLKREVYSAKNMPRDPKKIDDSYQYMKLQEIRMAEMEAQELIRSNAGQIVIDIDDKTMIEPKEYTKPTPIPEKTYQPQEYEESVSNQPDF